MGRVEDKVCSEFGTKHFISTFSLRPVLFNCLFLWWPWDRKKKKKEDWKRITERFFLLFSSCFNLQSCLFFFYLIFSFSESFNFLFSFFLSCSILFRYFLSFIRVSNLSFYLLVAFILFAFLSFRSISIYLSI